MKRYLVAYRYGTMSPVIETCIRTAVGPPSSEKDLERMEDAIKCMPSVFPRTHVHVIGWSELGPEPDEPGV